MLFTILATVSVCLLAAVCAAPTHKLPRFFDLKIRRTDLATANSSRGQRAVQAVAQQWSSSDVDTSTRTRSDRRQLHVRSKNEIRRRPKRGAIVNGFTSWDYEPLELGAFRSGRG